MVEEKKDCLLFDRYKIVERIDKEDAVDPSASRAQVIKSYIAIDMAEKSSASSEKVSDRVII